MSSNFTDRQRRHTDPLMTQQMQGADQQRPPHQGRSPALKNRIDDASIIQRPWWQSGFIGYPASILLVGVALLLSYLLKVFASAPYFIGQPFAFAAAIIALFWGIGPMIFSTVLEYLVIDLFLISPFRLSIIDGWDDALTFGPFILAQLMIGLLTIQGESRRRHLLKAKKDIETEAHELERANRFKSLFVSIASHEIKTPITAIRAQAQLALRRATRQQQAVPDRQLWSTHMEKIEAETHRLQILVNDLLDLGSIDSGKMPLQFAECDLGKLCQKIVEDQQALSGRRIDLEISAANPILVQADYKRLTQVTINLVANAVKYSPENTPIQVMVGRNQTCTIMQIHNDGPVIPQEYQEHIFEPFYRLASNEQGSGLGLAISKEIVERHSGHIWVESSAEKGTTFFVELPY